jgi:multiple sugar transport system permease protein
MMVATNVRRSARLIVGFTGLQTWNVTTGANKFLFILIITGALVASIPLLIGCGVLQRFWRGGLGAGSVKG